MSSKYLSYGLLVSVFSCYISLPLPRVVEIQKITENPLEDVGGKDTLVLNCIVKGDGISISWKFNNIDIIETAMTKFSKGNSQLKIEEMKLSNSGNYKCIATNHYGSSFGQIFVKVHSMGSFEQGFSVEDAVHEIDAQIGKPLIIKCPPHKTGIGQVYWWGDLPVSSPPILWSNGKPSPLGFIADHKYVFAYLTEEVIQDINIVGGISCILYQSQHSIQSVKQKINVIEKDDNKNFSASLESFMEKENYAVNKAKSYTMNCGATGRPLPEITWFKNGKAINETKPYEIRDGGMSLNIRPVTFESAGTYKCIAKNFLGSSEKEGQLIVESHPLFSKELESLNVVTYGETLKLSCVAQSFPLSYYEWYLNNTSISSNNEFIINGGNLIINAAKFSHAGLYLCVALNTMHTGVHTNVSAGYVMVKALAPRIQEKFPSTVYVFKNHKSVIFCNISGHPDPEFSWKHKSVAIANGGRFTVHKNGSLIIENVEEQDGGEYVCTARNIEGTASQQANVKVIEKVKIFKRPMNRVFMEYTPAAQLLCDATYESSLSFKIEWYCNNEIFQQKDERVYLEKRVKGFSRVLYFKNISRVDAATYGCKVYNMDGNKIISTDEASGSVEVIAPPTNLQYDGNCTVNKTIILSWNSQVASGTTEFVIEYSAAGTELWRKYITVKNTYAQLEVSTLPPSALLLFRVTMQDIDNIFNEIFVSNPSSATKDVCATPTGAPVKNPQNIRALAMFEGELKVKWDKLDLLDQPGPGFALVVNFNKLGETVTDIKVDGNAETFEVPQPGINNEFNVKVFAINNYGSKYENKEFHFKSGGKAPEGVVSNLQQLSVSHCCVNLAWDTVPSISHYRIYYEVNVQSRNRRSLDVINYTDVSTNNVTLGGLIPATEYKISVSALNEQVAGTPSQPIFVKTLEKVLEYIDMPMNGRAAIFGSVVFLTWDPPIVVGPIEAITSYQVTYYKYDNPSEKMKKELGGDSTGVYIYNLEKLNYYTFEVAANTKTRTGKLWVVKGVSVTYPDSPGQPAAPHVEVVNNTLLNVTFKLPKDYEGDLPNKYHIYYKPADSKEDGIHNARLKSSAYPDMPWVLLDSLESKLYRIFAVGENAMGVSLPSNVTLGHPISPALPYIFSQSVPFYKELWFIILVIVLLILIVVCIILCCVLCRSGGQYPVKKKEKLRGGWDNEPLKDYADDQMQEFDDLPLGNTEIKPPARRASENSLSKRALYSDDDQDSLEEYAEDARFEEDGSFIGQYGDEKKNGNVVKV